MRTTGSPARCIAAALLLSTAVLGSCSPAPEQPYCDALVSAEAEWKDAGASLADPASASRFLRTVTRIEQQAPEEVRADWKALHTLFAKFTVANPDLGALTAQLKGFQSSAKRIETHAHETCGVDLGS